LATLLLGELQGTSPPSSPKPGLEQEGLPDVRCDIFGDEWVREVLPDLPAKSKGRPASKGDRTVLPETPGPNLGNCGTVSAKEP
jgi:hypothetical protein